MDKTLNIILHFAWNPTSKKTKTTDKINQQNLLHKCHKIQEKKKGSILPIQLDTKFQTWHQ